MSHTQRLAIEQEILNKAICLDSETYAIIRSRMIHLFGYNTFRHYMLPIACKYSQQFYGWV